MTIWRVCRRNHGELAQGSVLVPLATFASIVTILSTLTFVSLVT